VQVYNETLRDLLAPAGTGRNAPGRTLEHASIKHDTSGGFMGSTLAWAAQLCLETATPVIQAVLVSSQQPCLILAVLAVAAAGGGTQVTGATRVVISAADDAAEVMRRAAAARACEVCRQGADLS
jgi:hypothetical protein